MITYVDNTTGARFPERGFGCAFELKDGVVVKYFQPGHGWKKAKKNQFKQEEIPDLEHTDQEDYGVFTHPDGPAAYRRYVEKYGDACAMAFLRCCEISKPLWHQQIINPDPNRPGPLTQQRFKNFFGLHVFRFQDALINMAGRWSFDILRFERWLIDEQGMFEFQRKMRKASMEQFITHKWGKEASLLVEQLILSETMS